MTLAQAITQYQATKCESSFATIYQSIYKGGRSIVRTFANKYRLDEQDVESMVNEKLLDIVTKFEGSADKLKNAVYSAVKLGCIDLVRKRNFRDKHSVDVMYEDDSGELHEIYEIVTVAPTTAEDVAIENTKKRDQRQLTTFLLSNTSEQTLTSALAFIQTNSYVQAAKLAGTTDKTVKSRLRSLSKQFDSNQFGNYYDYFTTATVHIG